MSVRLMIFGVAVSCLALSGLSSAQDQYPSRPIRMVVANGPGSAADAIARLLSEGLRQDLKTDVIVANQPGAIGLFQASVLTAAVAINPNLPYDPINDFTPLAHVGVNALALVVSSGSRWK